MLEPGPPQPDPDRISADGGLTFPKQDLVASVNGAIMAPSGSPDCAFWQLVAPWIRYSLSVSVALVLAFNLSHTTRPAKMEIIVQKPCWNTASFRSSCTNEKVRSSAQSASLLKKAGVRT